MNYSGATAHKKISQFAEFCLSIRYPIALRGVVNKSFPIIKVSVLKRRADRFFIPSPLGEATKKVFSLAFSPPSLLSGRKNGYKKRKKKKKKTLKNVFFPCFAASLAN